MWRGIKFQKQKMGSHTDGRGYVFLSHFAHSPFYLPRRHFTNSMCRGIHGLYQGWASIWAHGPHRECWWAVAGWGQHPLGSSPALSSPQDLGPRPRCSSPPASSPIPSTCPHEPWPVSMETLGLLGSDSMGPGATARPQSAPHMLLVMELMPTAGLCRQLNTALPQLQLHTVTALQSCPHLPIPLPNTAPCPPEAPSQPPGHAPCSRYNMDGLGCPGSGSRSGNSSCQTKSLPLPLELPGSESSCCTSLSPLWAWGHWEWPHAPQPRLPPV